MAISSLLETGSGELVIVTPDMSVAEGASLMSSKHVGMLMVTEQTKLIGVLTDRDIAMQVAQGRDCMKTKIREAMSADPITISEDIGLYDALKTMSKYGVRRLPIIGKKGSVVKGVISLDDILKILSKEFAKIGGILKWEVRNERSKETTSVPTNRYSKEA